MPEAKTAPIHRYYFTKRYVHQQKDGIDRPFCRTYGHDEAEAETDAKAASDALNAAIENEEHPWVGDGPTVAEAGGDVILARIHGLLHRTEWRKSGSFGAWYPEGKTIVTPPTGWRPMPKAGTASE